MQKMQVEKIKILRLRMRISGTRWERPRGGQNEGSEAKMVGHVKKRCLDVPVRRCDRLDLVGRKRGRDSPKYWGEVIKHDMTIFS